MAWLILTIILGLIGGAGLIWATSSLGRERFAGFAVAGGATVIWLILTFFMSLHNVGQRQVGIVYNFSGTIAGKKDPGVVMTWPWQHVKTENVGIQHEEYNLDVTNAAVSADQQPIYARLAVNLQVDPERVVDLYKRIGPEWKHILLESRVLQDFKEITSGFKTADITNRREELRIQAKERLTAEMEPYDIRIIDVFVRNIGFSEAYSRAIEEKLVQQQAALRAQFKADAVRKEAEGEASAIRLKGAALRANPEVLRLRAIETLNPNAQVIICTGRTCPSFLPSGLAGR